MHYKHLLILIFLLYGTYGAPALVANFTEESALKYLLQFGHIGNRDSEEFDGDILELQPEYQRNFNQYLKNFQDYAGLPQTGVLDQVTMDLMTSPRCGVADVNHRSQLYFGKWEKKELTYRVVKYSKKMSNNAVDRICRRAMDLWERAADIQFRKVIGKADIEILFASGDHGDPGRELKCGYPFDGNGTGTILAHAFYPRTRWCPKDMSGDIHIDDDEDWSEIHNVGLDLLHTVTHELGHSLGLTHSQGIQGTIMASHHPGWTQNLKMHSDDIERIQNLYGKAKMIDDKLPLTRPGKCICDDLTRFDSKLQKNVGNCKTEYRGQKWCFIKETSNCPDTKASSKVDRNWSWEACNQKINPTSSPDPTTMPSPTPGNCICDSFTRFDPKRDRYVGNCQTKFRGETWCYIQKTTDCPDSKASSAVDMNWSREACNN